MIANPLVQAALALPTQDALGVPHLKLVRMSAQVVSLVLHTTEMQFLVDLRLAASSVSHLWSVLISLTSPHSIITAPIVLSTITWTQLHVNLMLLVALSVIPLSFAL